MHEENRKNVKVVVLGDIGRSPRMQYHSLSLTEMGHRVDVIGYGETDPMDSVKLNPHILYHYMFPVPQLPIKLINYVFKTIFQAINLFFLLFITTRSDIVLVQNPPAIPTMLVCWFYAKVVGAKFIIDWHNYAYTIMGLSIGNKNPLVKITKQVEIFMGRRADSNFCVTKAMKDHLHSNWDIKSITVYDRPPQHFKPITLEEKHKFLMHFSHKYAPEFLSDSEESLFTKNSNDDIKLKSLRPGLLVSSTSWTEDEDFSVLLSALQDYENHCRDGNIRDLPKLVCVITGKGPMKGYYLKKINRLNWQFVTIITPWLESGDYPLLLASADLGVSLHTSSSGLDLPMKVVDMFGCGLPVCAFNFKCLQELVKHEENSYIFNTSKELATQLLNWFESFPNNNLQKQLVTKFKTQLKSFQTHRWRENWTMNAAPTFT